MEGPNKPYECHQTSPWKWDIPRVNSCGECPNWRRLSHETGLEIATAKNELVSLTTNWKCQVDKGQGGFV